MENSKISWTDHTFNPIMGCTKVSPGCANCYAENQFDSRLKVVKWGPHGTRILTNPKNWLKLLKADEVASRGSSKRLVFVASLADMFEDWTGLIHTHGGEIVLCCPDCTRMGPLDDRDWFYEQGEIEGVQQVGCMGCEYKGPAVPATFQDVRNQLFGMINSTPNLLYQLLTKRPENVVRFWPDCAGNPFFVNVGVGITVEDQQRSDERVQHAGAIRDLCPAMFLSCEPLLGPLDLKDWLMPDVQWEPPMVELVIVGGESGPNARPANPEWFRSIRDQCKAAEVAFHFKQWGEWLGGRPFTVDGVLCFDGFNGKVYRDIDRSKLYLWKQGPYGSLRVGKKEAGSLLDGVAHTTRLNEV